MNNFCRELNFSSELYPKLDLSKYDTEGYDWATFHKTPAPSELNNNYLFQYLESLGLSCKWIELFYAPPKSDGIIHCDNTDYIQYTKIYFQFGAEGSTLRWWDSNKIRKVSTSVGGDNGKDTDYSSHEVDILVSDEKDSKIIYEKDLRNPHIVNVGKLHSPHNPTNEKRFVITLAICDLDGRRILWDEAIDKLSNNII